MSFIRVVSPHCCLLYRFLKTGFKHDDACVRVCVPLHVDVNYPVSASSLICSPLKPAWRGCMFWIMLHSKALQAPEIWLTKPTAVMS